MEGAIKHSLHLSRIFTEIERIVKNFFRIEGIKGEESPLY
jgi:hypothetical protein